MGDEPAYPRECDLLYLDLSVRVEGREAARDLAHAHAEPLRAFGGVTVLEPFQFGDESSPHFTLKFELKADPPAASTRQKLLDFLADAWETKVQLERVSEAEAEEAPISKWIEGGYKKNRKRFALPHVWAATLTGPITVYAAEDEEWDDDATY